VHLGTGTARLRQENVDAKIVADGLGANPFSVGKHPWPTDHGTSLRVPVKYDASVPAPSFAFATLQLHAGAQIFEVSFVAVRDRPALI